MSEGFPKAATKPPEERLADLREAQRSISHARETGDAAAAEEIMERYRYLVEPEALEGEVSFEDAERLFGSDFLGAKKLEQVFGKKLDLAPIPFKKEELERAKELGQQLIYQTDAMDAKNPDTGKMERNVPLTLENLRTYFPKTHDSGKFLASQGSSDFWYKNEDFFKNEKPRVGWRLTSKDLVPGTTSKNYVDQTDRLIEHLKNDIFKDVKLPKECEDAIAEWTKKRPEIEPLAKSGDGAEWTRASQMLIDLKITKLLRETPVEVAYRLIANDQANQDKPLPSTYTWTASRVSDGDLVYVGGFGSGGAVVVSAGPDGRNGRLGVSLSRS